jgi:hypothetical protein
LARVFRPDSQAGGAENDKGFKVLGRPEGAFILKEAADGVPVADICRKVGISQATHFTGAQIGGLLPTEMRRLKQLEDVCHKHGISGAIENRKANTVTSMSRMQRV